MVNFMDDENGQRAAGIGSRLKHGLAQGPIRFYVISRSRCRVRRRLRLMPIGSSPQNARRVLSMITRISRGARMADDWRCETLKDAITKHLNALTNCAAECGFVEAFKCFVIASLSVSHLQS